MKRQSFRVRTTLGLAVALVAFQLGVGQADAQGGPTVTVGTPTVQGDYVNLTGTITSPDNCQIGTGTGCPAAFIIAAAPIPPDAGPTLVPLFWSNESAPQPLSMAANMRTIRKQLGIPPTTTTWTVVLEAQWGGLSPTYSAPQTFTWPAGTLSLSKINLLRADAPTLAYRLSTGATDFRSAVSTVTIRTFGGRRLGSFRDSSEPGQNLVRIPHRLARKMQPGVRYRVSMRARDEFGRRARRSAVAIL
jgi:hypothetical protein